MTFSASPLSVPVSGTVTASWANVSPATTKDWIGVYKPGTPNSAYLSWEYDNSCTKTAGNTPKASGSCPFVMPATPGTYELRLLANNGYTQLGPSVTIIVS